MTAPAPTAVTPEDAKFVIAFKEDIIEKKLKPFLEFTTGFAGPNVVEMVCSMFFFSDYSSNAVVLS